MQKSTMGIAPSVAQWTQIPDITHILISSFPRQRCTQPEFWSTQQGHVLYKLPEIIDTKLHVTYLLCINLLYEVQMCTISISNDDGIFLHALW